MAKVETALKEKEKRLSDFLEIAAKLQPTADPTIFVADLYKAQHVRKPFNYIMNLFRLIRI